MSFLDNVRRLNTSERISKHRICVPQLQIVRPGCTKPALLNFGYINIKLRCSEVNSKQGKMCRQFFRLLGANP